jgi:SAM-dependent methyltransferase
LPILSPTGESDVKLDLGAGDASPEGFTPLGRAHGSEIFPLPYADGTVDEIRASHVLEHYPFRQVPEIVAEWVRVLKCGGKLRIAVPDLAEISRRYLAGEQQPTEAFIVGGQVDDSDYHKAVFDRDKLRQLLAGAGLALVRPWTSELADCAAYPISLNLEGTKPFQSEIKVSAAMSVPRLGFMDNFGCAIDALLPLGIKLRRQGGAFWGQALTNCMERILDEDMPDAILTLDYDTVFTIANVAHLMQLMIVHPEADAIAPLQSSRHLPTALFTKKGEDGDAIARIDRDLMQPDLMPISTAHFGLTLIRADKLRALPKPWFLPVPGADGAWHEGHVDEDINFWVQWEKAGNSLHLANHVVIGHLEVMARWPGKDLQTIYQSMRDFNTSGPPAEIWS